MYSALTGPEHVDICHLKRLIKRNTITVPFVFRRQQRTALCPAITKDIRNIAFVGHSGSGKTTLAEALLVKSGAKGEAGTVERGSTTLDSDPIERKYQNSLDSGIASLDYKGMHLNLIDTPGIPDFRGPTLASMTAVETTAIVINAHAGIEMSTRRLMRRAKQRRLCRMIIINRIDAEGSNLTKLVNEIQDEFGPACLPINLPAENLSTVRDCFFHTEGETDIFSLLEAHTAILDQVVEVNEELMKSISKVKNYHVRNCTQRLKSPA